MKKILLSLAVVGLFAVRANANVLADYPFTGSSRNSTDSDPLTSASAITDVGFANTVDATRGNPSPSLTVDASNTDSSVTAAATAGNYIHFTLAPNSGASFSLTSLTLDAAVWSNTTFVNENFAVRSSIDGFSANIGGVQSIAGTSNGAITPFSFDLSGAGFQNLSAPIEFRIYSADSSSTSGKGILYDNIILNGTTTGVPEPATWMLMGVGLLLGAQRLRRKA